MKTKQNLFEALVKLADMKKMKEKKKEEEGATNMFSKIADKVIEDKKELFM